MSRLLLDQTVISLQRGLYKGIGRVWLWILFRYRNRLIWRWRSATSDFLQTGIYTNAQ
jgi:hypothetical protein